VRLRRAQPLSAVRLQPHRTTLVRLRRV